MFARRPLAGSGCQSRIHCKETARSFQFLFIGKRLVSSAKQCHFPFAAPAAGLPSMSRTSMPAGKANALGAARFFWSRKSRCRWPRYCRWPARWSPQGSQRRLVKWLASPARYPCAWFWPLSTGIIAVVVLAILLGILPSSRYVQSSTRPPVANPHGGPLLTVAGTEPNSGSTSTAQSGRHLAGSGVDSPPPPPVVTTAADKRATRPQSRNSTTCLGRPPPLNGNRPNRTST